MGGWGGKGKSIGENQRGAERGREEERKRGREEERKRGTEGTKRSGIYRGRHKKTPRGTFFCYKKICL